MFKSRTIKGLFFTAAVLMAAVLTASCSMGEDAVLTINLGGAGRAVGGGDSKDYFISGLDYTITFSGSMGSKTYTPSGGQSTVRVTVQPGVWNIDIKATHNRIEFASGSVQDVNLVSGYNTVQVKMDYTDKYTFHHVKDAADWDTAASLIGDSGSSTTHIIVVTGNFSVSGINTATFGTANTDVIIFGGGHSVTLNSNGSLLNIGSSQTVTMNNLTLTGRGPTVSNNTSLVFINGGELTMNGGAIKSNLASGVDGGGVRVIGGTFIMEGGASVSNNESIRVGTNDNGNGGNGGGVYVYNGSTFTMRDNASVHDNTAPRHGGGVFINNNVTFTMEGSASVRNNEVTGITGVPNYNGLGGGVYVNNGIFIMKGSASVSYNEITGSFITTEFGNGGGVHIFDGEFTMQDSASVSGNSANDGGGVIIDKSTFTMNGGSISGNISRNNGGGVHVLSDNTNNSTFTMNGGSISGNSAQNNGGGVYVDDTSNGIFTKTGNSIIYGSGAGGNSNTAAVQGHAVYVERATTPSYKNATAGSGVALDSSNIASGGWD